MKGNPKVIEALNGVLTKELTAINQYFLHARMLQDWGLHVLGDLEYKASIDEMKHADQIIKRILFLEGLPNVQKLNKINIGTTVEEILASDLKVEYEAREFLQQCIATSEQEKDYVSRDLFLSILKSEEHHIDWLETQQTLVSKTGIQNYSQTQIDMAETAKE